MGVSIQDSNAKFEQSNVITSIFVPDTEGVIAEFFFGGDFATTSENSSGPENLVEVDSPVYQSNYARVSTDNVTPQGYDLTIGIPDDLTIVTVQRIVSGKIPFFSTTPNFTGFFNGSGTDIGFYNTQSGSPPGVANLPAPVHGNFFMSAGRGALAGFPTVSIYDGGVRTDNTGTSAGDASRPSLPFQIGQTSVGINDFAYVLVFNRVLSDLELDTLYSTLKTAMLSIRGLEIQ